MLWWFAIASAALPVIVFAASRLYARTLLRPTVDPSPPRDMLISVAHSDDCAILAGEWGIEAARAGRRVQVVYLTCGSDRAESDRARARKAEAIAAWALAGVPESNLHFLDLPHTEAGKALAYDETELARVRAFLEARIRELPAGAVVVTNADGETHPDHNTNRRVCLDALRSSERNDLRVLEGAQYNQHVSPVRTPEKAVRAIVNAVPLASRALSRFLPRVRPSLPAGGAPVVLPTDAARMERKRAMLHAFISENGGLLEHLFWFPDRLREVDLASAECATAGRWYLRSGERLLAPSYVAYWWSAALALGAIGAAASREALAALRHSGWALSVAGSVGGVLVLGALLRPHSFERRVLALGLGLGVAAVVVIRVVLGVPVSSL